MALTIDWLTVDTPDPDRLAKFWCAVLDYDVIPDDGGSLDVDDDEREVLIGGRGRPRILFIEVHDAKIGKNRLHLDLRASEDEDAEVERLLALGATRVDIGQGDPSWTVLADPDGNEFCVLRAPTEEELDERKGLEALGKW